MTYVSMLLLNRLSYKLVIFGIYTNDNPIRYEHTYTVIQKKKKKNCKQLLKNKNT